MNTTVAEKHSIQTCDGHVGRHLEKQMCINFQISDYITRQGRGQHVQINSTARI